MDRGNSKEDEDFWKEFVEEMEKDPSIPLVKLDHHPTEDDFTDFLQLLSEEENKGKILKKTETFLTVPMISTRYKRKSGDKNHLMFNDKEYLHTRKYQRSDDDTVPNIQLDGCNTESVLPAKPKDAEMKNEKQKGMATAGMDFLKVPNEQYGYDPAKSPKLKARRRLSSSSKLDDLQNVPSNKENDDCSMSSVAVKKISFDGEQMQ